MQWERRGFITPITFYYLLLFIIIYYLNYLNYLLFLLKINILFIYKNLYFFLFMLNFIKMFINIFKLLIKLLKLILFCFKIVIELDFPFLSEDSFSTFHIDDTDSEKSPKEATLDASCRSLMGTLFSILFFASYYMINPAGIYTGEGIVFLIAGDILIKNIIVDFLANILDQDSVYEDEDEEQFFTAEDEAKAKKRLHRRRS
jgi:hypothetical protein